MNVWLGRLVLLTLLGATSCSPEQPEVSRALYELERLAFVPAGGNRLSGYQGPYSEFLLERPLLVDRYEVTLGDWRHYFDAEDSIPGSNPDLNGEPDTWPIGLTLDDAVRLAQLRGMRLLTASEWIYVASGPRGHPFPWGASSQSSLANCLELRLDRPAAVGTFENGVGPFGCHDLLGNVWEWVSDRIPGRGPSNSGATEGVVSVMGGSWRSRMLPLYFLPESYPTRFPVFNAMTVGPDTWSRDIGVRHAADAAEYLWENSAKWGTDDEARRRLIAVGRRFGDEALELIESLGSRPGASPNLEWLASGARL